MVYHHQLIKKRFSVAQWISGCGYFYPCLVQQSGSSFSIWRPFLCQTYSNLFRWDCWTHLFSKWILDLTTVKPTNEQTISKTTKQPKTYIKKKYSYTIYTVYTGVICVNATEHVWLHVMCVLSDTWCTRYRLGCYNPTTPIPAADCQS